MDIYLYIMILSFENFSSRNRFWTCPVDKSIYPVEDLWVLPQEISIEEDKLFSKTHQ
jgi:hypothetical protein